MKTETPVADIRSEPAATWLMLPCALFWGAIFVCGKIAVQEAPPIAVATVRFAIASLVLVPLTLWREPGAFRLTWRRLLLACALGFTGVAGYNIMAMVALKLAPASDGASITPTLNPLVTALVAAYLFGERLTRDKLAGLGLAIVGVLLVAGGGSTAPAEMAARLWGDLLFVGAALCWSTYTLLGKRASAYFSPLAMSTLSTLTGLLLLVPLAWRDLVRLPWGSLSGPFWGAELILGLLSTVIAFWLWHAAVGRYGASRAASYLPLNPIFGVLMAVWLLGERLGPGQVVGMALSIAGVWLANRPARPGGRTAFPTPAKGRSAAGGG